MDDRKPIKDQTPCWDHTIPSRHYTWLERVLNDWKVCPKCGIKYKVDTGI